MITLILTLMLLAFIVIVWGSLAIVNRKDEGGFMFFWVAIVGPFALLIAIGLVVQAFRISAKLDGIRL